MSMVAGRRGSQEERKTGERGGVRLRCAAASGAPGPAPLPPDPAGSCPTLLSFPSEAFPLLLREVILQGRVKEATAASSLQNRAPF